jgi:CRP-like cAMP-binding protein
MSVDPQLLKQIAFLADLPEPATREIAAIAVRLRRAAGEILFLRGEPSPGIFLVLEGRVKITRESAGGREQVLHVLGAGNHFNSVPAFDGGPTPATAQVMADTALILLPNEPLRTIMRRHPDVALAFMAEQGVFLRRLVALVDDLALTTVQGRLARLLLAQAAAAERGEQVPALTQAEMAARLGTVREMVGRTLKVFESLGLLQVERGAITVKDRAGLEAQAEE